MLARTDRRLRLVLLIAIFALVACALIGRLAYWQIGQRDRLVGMARSQLQRTIVDPSQRGSIYDRSGTVALATTIYRDVLWATPAVIPEGRRADVADELVRILGAKGGDADTIRSAVVSDKPYAVLAKQLSASESDAISAGLRDGTLTGVGLDPTAVRDHPTSGGGPHTSLASQLVGFVDSQGDGRYGIEQRWQTLLAGTPRRSIAQFDAAGNPIAATRAVVDPGTVGADLQLTIDASLQLKFEQELLAAATAHGASFASAVAMDPFTGEIVAWATAPGYDASDYRSIADSDPERFVDPIADTVYEPGSVFKLFVTLAGLERGSFTLASRFNDTGSFEANGSVIRDSDRKAMGVMSVADIVAYSRNVGAARMAMKLGPDTKTASGALFAVWKALGFGAATGVETAGEVAGIARDPQTSPWTELDLANGSFGQGVAVTQIQLAQAYSAMVNGGILVHPHVVRVAAGEPIATEPGRRVMSADMSAQLTGLLRHVVTTVPWYAKGTLIPGLDVGGKTGTAQIWDSKAGEYKPHSFNLSFVGFVGQDAPRLVIAVRIADARNTAVAIPVNSHEVFRRLAQDAMATLDLPAPPQIALDDGSVADPVTP